jgi:hypothetical protein
MWQRTEFRRGGSIRYKPDSRGRLSPHDPSLSSANYRLYVAAHCSLGLILPFPAPKLMGCCAEIRTGFPRVCFRRSMSGDSRSQAFFFGRSASFAGR